ncbi:ribosome silencing factor [soil metagenome]
MVKTARAIKTVPRTASEALTEAIINGLQDKKGKEIVCLDLSAIHGAVADVFIVCTGDSTTHTDALARSVEDVVLKQIGELPAHIEGKNNAQWVLLDYINIVVHIFLAEQRDYFGIERLWADAETRKIEANY